MGSIGVINGYMFLGSPAGTDAYLVYGNSSVYPSTSTGADRDAAINLGASASRFKDLYLSGGVYLGGTVAANHLDDYEEGTWTPTPNSGTTSAADGRYTKIGRTVLFEFTVILAGDATGSTGFSITNLPFATASSTRGSGAIRFTNSNLSNITAHVSTSSNVLSFYQTDGTTLTYTEFGLTNRIDVAGFSTV